MAGGGAQQRTMPVAGFVSLGSNNIPANRVAAFQRGLSETGYVEGQNVTVEYRWAENQADQLPTLAADLIRRRLAKVHPLPTFTQTRVAADAAWSVQPPLRGEGDGAAGAVPPSHTPPNVSPSLFRVSRPQAPAASELEVGFDRGAGPAGVVGHDLVQKVMR
jgi:hypothetical protein